MSQNSPSCFICNSKNILKKFQKNNYYYWICKNCTNGFIYPLPAKDIIEIYYGDHYHNRKRYQANIRHNKRTWDYRLDIVEQFVTNKGKCLDIGCATGQFLTAAQQRGWDILGIEISKAGVEKAGIRLGDKVRQTDLLKFSTTGKFDLITAWAVMEHVRSPRLHIDKIYSLLKPDGIFALTTPNNDSDNFKKLQDKWRFFIPPEHIFYYNKHGLEYLFSGKLEIKHCRTFTHLNSYLDPDSILLKLNKHSFTRPLLRQLFKKKLAKQNKMLKGDTLEIIAQRI